MCILSGSPHTLCMCSFTDAGLHLCMSALSRREPASSHVPVGSWQKKSERGKRGVKKKQKTKGGSHGVHQPSELKCVCVRMRMLLFYSSFKDDRVWWWAAMMQQNKKVTLRFFPPPITSGWGTFEVCVYVREKEEEECVNRWNNTGFIWVLLAACSSLAHFLLGQQLVTEIRQAYRLCSHVGQDAL